MKTSAQIIIGAAVFVVLTGTIAVCLLHNNSHRGMRHMKEAAYSRPQGRGQRDMRGKDGRADMPMMRGMRPDREHGQMNSMRRGMENIPMDSMRRGNMREERMMGTMPALTEKQRKEIAELRQKQQEELNQLRREMSSKMNSLVQAQHDKVMELLTPEQKKYIESQARTTLPPQAK
jgi:hypothetical protein